MIDLSRLGKHYSAFLIKLLSLVADDYSAQKRNNQTDLRFGLWSKEDSIKEAHAEETNFMLKKITNFGGDSAKNLFYKEKS